MLLYRAELQNGNIFLLEHSRDSPGLCAVPKSTGVPCTAAHDQSSEDDIAL